MLGLNTKMPTSTVLKKSLNYVKAWRLNNDSDASGFDDGWEDSWVGPGTVAVMTMDGVQKIEITASPGAEVALIVLNWADYIPVLPGQKYIYELYTKISGDVYSYAGCDLNDGAKGWVSTVSGNHISTTTYSRSYVEFTVPAGIFYLGTKLVLQPNAADDLGSGWFKNAVLRRLA